MPETVEQALEICLEKLTDPSACIEDYLHQFPQYQEQLVELIPVLISLQTLQQVVPSETFSKNAANRLVKKLPTASVTFLEGIRLIFQRNLCYPIRRFGMINLMITIVVAVSLFLGGTHAVQALAPGDLLYPLERAFEQIRLMITNHPVQEAKLRTQYANERLREAELRLEQGKLEYALKALTAYGEIIVGLEELVENQDGQVRAAMREMIQEELALQAGIVERIRFNWPEDAQARNALQQALQRSNRGLEQLFGPPESAPQGPAGDPLKDPPNQEVQGPIPEAPLGPNPEAPQEPNPEAPQEPNPEAPQEPNPEAPQGPNPEAPQGPNPEAPGEPTETPSKGSSKPVP